MRTAENAENLRAAGFDAHIFDLDDGYTGLDDRGLAALASATHVLATVPPVADIDRDPLLAQHGDALAAEGASLRWAGYLDDERPGDHGGRVDERAETRVPAGGRAAARLQAEREWLELRAPRRPARVARLPPRRHLRAGALGAAHGGALRRHERRRRGAGAPTRTRRRRRCSATCAPSAPTVWRQSRLARPRRRHWRRAPRVDGGAGRERGRRVYNIGDDGAPGGR